MIRIITAGLITAGLALTPIDLAAQSGSGVISDIVQDASGGALPGATVEVVNDATGVRTATVSNEEGVYRSSGLVPGSYTLDATRSGFAAVKRGPIVLAVAQVLALDLEPRRRRVRNHFECTARPHDAAQRPSGILKSPAAFAWPVWDRPYGSPTARRAKAREPSAAPLGRSTRRP
jgi:hypothetical protein